MCKLEGLLRHSNNDGGEMTTPLSPSRPGRYTGYG